MGFRLCILPEMKFNVEFFNGDPDAGVDKLGEVQKYVRDVVVVVVVVDPRERSGSPRSKTPEAGALKTPVRSSSSRSPRRVAAAGPLGGGESARRRGGSARQRVGSRRRADRVPAGRAALFLNQSRT